MKQSVRTNASALIPFASKPAVRGGSHADALVSELSEANRISPSFGIRHIFCGADYVRSVAAYHSVVSGTVYVVRLAAARSDLDKSTRLVAIEN